MLNEMWVVFAKKLLKSWMLTAKFLIVTFCYAFQIEELARFAVKIQDFNSLHAWKNTIKLFGSIFGQNMVKPINMYCNLLGF